eukprot:g48431.t1
MWDYKAGGGGGELTRSNEVMDSVGDGALMGHGGVVVKGEVGPGVRALCNIEVRPPDHRHPAFVSGLDSEMGIAAERVECCTLGGGEVDGEIKAVDAYPQRDNEEVQG